MARRFRIWEASAVTQSQSGHTPTRSMAADVSNSFLSAFESNGSQST
eukprot:gene24378-27573_t